MIKKIATFIMGLGLIASSSLAFVSANGAGAENTDAYKATGGFGLNATTSAGISGISGAGTNAGGSLISVIKSTINWALGLLGLITFVLLLWGGFQMVTAAGDDKKFGEGLKILKNAGIGLAFIALSWLMVSVLFWVINAVTSNAGVASGA